MEHTTLTEQECIARTNEHHEIGVDAKGRTHYYDAISQTAWVVVDDEPAHIERASLSTWISFVAERVGWDFHRYDETPIFEALVAHIAEAI